MGSRESRATPVSGVCQVREHGPKRHGTAWDDPNATPSLLGAFLVATCRRSPFRTRGKPLEYRAASKLAHSQIGP